MYESSFGLSDRPFVAAPVARRYFPAAAIEAARLTLVRCIDRAEGIGLVLGPAGTGKSLLCQVLAEHFRSRYFVALLASGRIDTRKALLQAVLFELGLPYRGMDEGELRLSLLDRLGAPDASKGGLLLLVDEAHSTPLRLLEEIHQLTNLVRGGQPRVRVVLAGNSALEEHLGNAKLESLNQRIAVRCYLQSFKHAETLDYVRRAISQSGGDADELFSSDALDAIHRATDGVPRLVNQLCDHALLLAYAAGTKPLSAEGIEEAWADLQQLPTRWNAAPGTEAPSADIIEFGSLDEPAIAARITPDDRGAPPRPAPATEPASRLRKFGDDDMQLFTGEPAQRIERIKDQLGTIDEQFQPAGTIGPEVELVFSHAEANPFEEPFEEEELIVDRFAGVGKNPFAGATIVCSAEGADLASLLAPHARTKKESAKSPGAAAKIVPPRAVDTAATMHSDISRAPVTSTAPVNLPFAIPPIIASIDRPIPTSSIEFGPLNEADSLSIRDSLDESTPSKRPDYTPPLADTLPISGGWIHPSEDPVMPEEPRSATPQYRAAGIQPTIPMPRNPAVARASRTSAMPATDGQTVAPLNPMAINSTGGPKAACAETVAESLSKGDQAANNLDDDSNVDEVDVIVVEDDPVPPPPTGASTVRRQEYRQLFARLRRGS